MPDEPMQFATTDVAIAPMFPLWTKLNKREDSNP